MLGIITVSDVSRTATHTHIHSMGITNVILLGTTINWDYQEWNIKKQQLSPTNRYMVTAAGIQALNCTYVTEFVVNQKLLR